MASKNDALIEDRVEQLEELVKRVLSLQRFDDLTIGAGLVPSNLCTSTLR